MPINLTHTCPVLPVMVRQESIGLDHGVIYILGVGEIGDIEFGRQQMGV